MHRSHAHPRTHSLSLHLASYTPLQAIDIWAVGCILAELLNGRPLFPGRDYGHQLDLILDVIGTPTLEEFYGITSRRSRDYIRALPIRKRRPFTALFPKASTEAIDFLQKTLVSAPVSFFCLLFRFTLPACMSVCTAERGPDSCILFLLGASATYHNHTSSVSLRSGWTNCYVYYVPPPNALPLGVDLSVMIARMTRYSRPRRRQPPSPSRLALPPFVDVSCRTRL